MFNAGEGRKVFLSSKKSERFAEGASKVVPSLF